MMLLMGLTVWLTEYSSNQNTIQRFVAARSMHEARKGMLVCVLFSLPIWAFYMFLGTALFVFFDVFPTVDASAMLTGEQKAEQVLPYFMINHLPPGLLGLVIAAALAAAMSSLDSSINAISTVSIVDLYRRHIKKGAKDKHYLKAAWVIAALTSVCMIVGAIFLQTATTKTLQDTATILASLLSGGLLGLYLLGFLTKKSSSGGDVKGIWVGIACTLVFTLWTILSKQALLPEVLTFPFDLYYTGLFGNFIMFLVGYLATQVMINTSRS